jgi:hypothetical protein
MARRLTTLTMATTGCPRQKLMDINPDFSSRICMLFDCTAISPTGMLWIRANVDVDEYMVKYQKCAK